MANGTLQGLLREPKHRLTGPAAFAQAVSRLSYVDTKKDEAERKPAKDARKVA